jgi:hypothetical protein
MMHIASTSAVEFPSARELDQENEDKQRTYAASVEQHGSKYGFISNTPLLRTAQWAWYLSPAPLAMAAPTALLNALDELFIELWTVDRHSGGGKPSERVLPSWFGITHSSKAKHRIVWSEYSDKASRIIADYFHKASRTRLTQVNGRLRFYFKYWSDLHSWMPFPTSTMLKLVDLRFAEHRQGLVEVSEGVSALTCLEVVFIA